MESGARELNPAVWYRESAQFLSEVRAEYRKVTWPTQKEAMAGTIGVLVVVVLLTTGLSIVDFSLGKLLSLVIPS